MERNRKIKISILAVGILFLATILNSLEFKSQSIHKELTSTSELNSKDTILVSESEPKAEVAQAAINSPTIEKNNIVLLNSENFESLSADCFQGTACEVEGDPWKQYLIIKHEGKNNITDLYIAFLRKKLSDPRFKDQYKDSLIKMIQDFYPADQVDFQMAAYYNYLGDFDSSLEAYLALEKKAKADPKTFKAPKLNIANTYYDLKRFREALVYYKASLNDSKSTETNDSLESIAFINERIDLIQTKLRK